MVDYQNTAQGLATLGRGGDSTLVHMQPEEVAGLQQLAQANGTSLTVNPNTGMPEAFNLRGLLPMVAGVGLAAAGMDPMMAGLMLGGATAVLENDLGAGIGAGLGAYGGASLGKSLDLLGAESVPIGSTTGEIVTDQIQQNLSNMNPTIAGPSGPGMTGFSSTAGGGTMGIKSGLSSAAVNPAYPQGPEFQGTNVGSIPRNVTPNLAGTNPAYPQGPGFQSPPANKPTMYRNYTQSGGVTGSPPVNNLPVAANPAYPQGPGFQATADTATKFKMPGSGVPGEAVYGQVSEDGLTGLANRAGNRVSNMGRGIDTLVNDYDRATEILGTQSEQVPVFNPDGSIKSYTMSKAVPLDNIDMAMKFGLPVAGGIAGGLEPEDFEQQSIDMTQFEDRRFRGPDGQLNLSGQTGLNLNNPYGYTAGGYGYAEGGAVEQGMEAAIARNSGRSYNPPAPAPASNVNTGGISNFNDLGSLNVNTGTTGQSPNAIAAEAAKPKTRIMTGAYGTQMTVPIDYDPGVKSVFGGRKPSHYQLKDGTYVKGTPPAGNYFNSDRTNAYGYVNKFAEGGTVETRADQGMRDALARNQGIAYAQPTTTASNVNTQPALNINRGMGSLNVNSGSIGQSANAIAEAARLKAIEDAKPKTYSGQNVGGGGGQGSFSVPSELVMGGGYRPTGAIMAGPAANYSRDIAGNYIRRAEGGPISAAYAQGGMLEGPGDGMSDSLAAQIDGSQPAALSQGEFVVPADVVSHLGNGSSDAGSKRLYAMMDEVRQARTGTEKQGKEINPERYMPA